MKKFRSRKIQVITNHRVLKVERHALVLSDTSKLPFGLAIWATGNTMVPLIQNSPFPKNKRGRILVDQFYRPKEFDNVSCIGDCAAFETSPLPQTAQVASQQGKYVAKFLNEKAKVREANKNIGEHELEERTKKQVGPFKFIFKGQVTFFFLILLFLTYSKYFLNKKLAYIGSKNALVDIPWYHSNGLFAWLLWRAAYITNLVSLRNKIIILFFWAKTYFFGRDISRF